MNDAKPRTVGRSFRISQQWLDGLNEEAEKQSLTPNALINFILRDYCLFHRYLKRLDIMAVTQKTVSRFAEACPKDKLEEIAQKAGSNIALDLFRSMGLRFNREDAVFFVTTILGEYANWFKCEHYKVGNKEIFHLRHNLGENWSYYVSEVITNLLEACCNQKVKSEFLDTAVTLEVPF
jgi:hypothetical protein